MSSHQEKAMLLEAMGIQQWRSRLPSAESSPEVSLPADLSTVDKATIAVSVTGNSTSGWLWLTEAAVSNSEQGLLADIQRTVNCTGGGLTAHADASATAQPQSLELAIAEHKISRLVIFGKNDFQEQVKASLKPVSVVQISTLALTELENTPTAKRQLWAELKNLLAQ
ncbi:MAG: DNA polymerase III subunit psi [Xanthomonadales bacterium]|nr:DNA polymerase III subunit psi [Xanthomonadales bacterium]